MIFKKNDKIKMSGKTYIAVCVDAEVAIFAPVKWNKKEKCLHTSYKNMFALPNLENMRDTIKFEFVDVIQ
jgi:hypothetical protein